MRIRPGVDVAQADGGKVSGLGVKRLDALDRVLVAALVLDKHEDEEHSSGERFRKETRPLLHARDALPGADEASIALPSAKVLLERFRRGCH